MPQGRIRAIRVGPASGTQPERLAFAAPRFVNLPMVGNWEVNIWLARHWAARLVPGLRRADDPRFIQFSVTSSSPH